MYVCCLQNGQVNRNDDNISCDQMNEQVNEWTNEWMTEWKSRVLAGIGKDNLSCEC